MLPSWLHSTCYGTCASFSQEEILRSETAFVSYFSCHCDKIPDRNHLREKGFILAHDFRRGSPSWWEGHGRWLQLTSWQPRSRRRDTERCQSKIYPRLHLQWPTSSIGPTSYLSLPLKSVISEWIKTMWYLYTMEFYAAMKKNEMLSFAGKWMELENIILSEVSLAQKIKNHMFSLICGH
jgi:hypothetical protein